MSHALNHQIPVPSRCGSTWNSFNRTFPVSMISCFSWYLLAAGQEIILFGWSKCKMIQVPLPHYGSLALCLLIKQSQSTGDALCHPSPFPLPLLRYIQGTSANILSMLESLQVLRRLLYPSWHLQSLQIFPLVFSRLHLCSGDNNIPWPRPWFSPLFSLWLQ